MTIEFDHYKEGSQHSILKIMKGEGGEGGGRAEDAAASKFKYWSAKNMPLL